MVSGPLNIEVLICHLFSSHHLNFAPLKNLVKIRRCMQVDSYSVFLSNKVKN